MLRILRNQSFIFKHILNKFDPIVRNFCPIYLPSFLVLLYIRTLLNQKMGKSYKTIWSARMDRHMNIDNCIEYRPFSINVFLKKLGINRSNFVLLRGKITSHGHPRNIFLFTERNYLPKITKIGLGILGNNCFNLGLLQGEIASQKSQKNPGGGVKETGNKSFKHSAFTGPKFLPKWQKSYLLPKNSESII